jgi:hypothetical protein
MKKMLFLLCPRRKKFSFKPFGLVMSRHRVVQEEMKVHAFVYYFLRSKNFSFKAFGQVTSRDIRWFKEK